MWGKITHREGERERRDWEDFFYQIASTFIYLFLMKFVSISRYVALYCTWSTYYKVQKHVHLSTSKRSHFRREHTSADKCGVCAVFFPLFLTNLFSFTLLHKC
jgi:hypothetical protein